MTGVVPASLAATAGVQVGDLLLAIDGESCRGQALPRVRRRLWIGSEERVTLRLRRGKDEVEVKVP